MKALLKPSEIIDAIVKRPALYFGTRSGYLREMNGFQFGADYGMYASGKCDSVLSAERDSPIPEAFVSFVCARVSLGKSRGPSWSGRIEDATKSEKEAWELF